MPDPIRKIQEGLEELLAQKLVLDEHAIVSLADLDRRITYVNDRFCEITKFERSELIGRSYDCLDAGYHPASFFEDMWRTVENGDVWHGEIKNKAKGGTVFWAQSTITPIRNLSGRVLGYAEVQTDITRQKEAERRASESQAKLRAALLELQAQKLTLDEHALVSMTDRRGRITYVNDRFCEVAKYSRAEMIGQDHRLLNSGHHPKTFFTEMWKTASAGNVWHGEIKNRAKDGSYYWVKSTVRAVRDDERRIVGFASVRTDITEQKAAERAAEDAHDRLRLAMRASGTVLWEINPKVGTLKLSDSFGVLLGYPLEDFPVDTAGLLCLVHPEDFAEGRQFIENLRASNADDATLEVRLRSYTNSYLWVRISARITTSENGFLQAFGAMSDITTAKQAALAMSNEKLVLERLVADRTVELQQQAEALSKALAREREMNETQRQFVSVASHEFRTPLAIIDSAAQFVARRAGRLTPEKVIENVETIRGAVRRMTNLMESTLAAAKLDAGKLKVKRSDCQIRALLTEVCNQQHRIAAYHHVALNLGNLPETIQGDSGALELVFANLLSNAVKYAPDL